MKYSIVIAALLAVTHGHKLVKKQPVSLDIQPVAGPDVTD